MQAHRSLRIAGLALVMMTLGVFIRPAEPASAHHIIAISAGGQHTCALTSSGGVQCWGRNHFGQLGNGELNQEGSYTPVDVLGLSTGVNAVASGAVHTCALTTAGGVKCWGNNAPQPTDVTGLGDDVVRIGAGYFMTCAVTSTGAVKCWSYSDAPQTVPDLGSGAVAAGVGLGFACALMDTGGVKCWGQNSQGQLGDGTTADSTTPVDVAGLSSGVQAIAVGESVSCALTSAGGVQCWGTNTNGELGIGNTNTVLGPQNVVGLSTSVEAITSTSGIHVCALLSGGAVKCWGYNGSGQVDGIGGFGLDQVVSVPTDAPAPDGVVQVSAGGYHTCALLDNGAVTCWGGDDYGQTGDSDGDGCTDFAEHGDNPILGGLRDHEDYWDFFDTPTNANARDAVISGSDIARLVARFGTTGDPGGNPLAAPPPFGYHTAFDRGGQVGANPWEQGPANGSVSGGDIGAVVAQYGHRCA
jgi:alpha-tubulin suppressor-like RCC1 family protein